MRSATETHFVVKCHACGQAYLVPRSKGIAQESYLAMNPRCINTTGTLPNNGRGAYRSVVASGRMCGAPLGRGMFSRGSDNARFVEQGDLLHYVVTRDVPPKVIEKVIERVVDDEETAALRAEVARLKEKYETPCKGLVRSWQGDHYVLVPCGGFLGHPGDCAEVW